MFASKQIKFSAKGCSDSFSSSSSTLSVQSSLYSVDVSFLVPSQEQV